MQTFKGVPAAQCKSVCLHGRLGNRDWQGCSGATAIPCHNAPFQDEPGFTALNHQRDRRTHRSTAGAEACLDYNNAVSNCDTERLRSPCQWTPRRSSIYRAEPIVLALVIEEALSVTLTRSVILAYNIAILGAVCV